MNNKKAVFREMYVYTDKGLFGSGGEDGGGGGSVNYLDY